MKTSDIKRPLIEAQETLAAAGSVAAARDIGELLALVDDYADMEFEQFISNVQRKLDPAAVKTSVRTAYVKMLQDAKMDEPTFKLALAKLASEPQFDKADVLAVAKGYGVIRLEGKSKVAYLDSIERYFYWLLNNRDANEMASRATPW